MKNEVVLNTVPVYGEAPVSFDVFQENTNQVLAEFMKIEADKHILLLPQGADIHLENKNIEIVYTSRQNGFTFYNDSAIFKVLEGEKPIPSEKNVHNEGTNRNVYTAEELLNTEKKEVYIQINSSTRNRYNLNKTITPMELLKESKCEPENVKAIYFGHPMGLIIGKEQLNQEIVLKTDYIEIWQETDCIVDRLLHISERYEMESCGRCVFGHEGVAQIHMILADLVQKKGRTSDAELLNELCSQMQYQTLCELGSSLAQTVLAVMEQFGDEMNEHLMKKSCRASVCKKFMTYHILPDVCTGCDECTDSCEDEAILGRKRFIHVIDIDECTQCGKCIDSCDEGAIVMAGALKPKCPKKPIPCKR